MKSKNYLQYSLALFLVATAISTVAGKCTCDAEDLERDPKSTTLKYRVIAIFAILASGAAGALLPVAGKWLPWIRPENDGFFMVKSFAAGVIIATAFIHILPDAFENLTSPCLKGSAWEEFPFTGFAAMLGALGTLMIDSTATGYYRRVHFRKNVEGQGPAAERAHAGHVHLHTHATHGHSHAGVLNEDGNGNVMEGGGVKEDRREEWVDTLTLVRHRVTSQVLELGIMVHSVIIGITLGVSGSVATIKTLMAALCFHQFFEGMGLGGCIVQAKFKSRAIITMVVFFAITTPLGVAIGIGIANVYTESSQTSLIVQGILDAVASGVLIYMALVDLLAADFMHDRVQNKAVLQFGCNVCLLLGAGCMSILAKWA